MVDSPERRLTVGITTRNRPAALARCLQSLHLIHHLVDTIIVFDDASDEPVVSSLPAGVVGPADPALHVERVESPVGQQEGRNRIVKRAATPLVLLLDDDAFLLEDEGVERAAAILDRDAGVAAIAFAQANADGESWPESMQPSRARYACLVPSFIGFAHLLRRDVFLQIGGYRDTFLYHGEEKEFCVRLLDIGFRVVYLPDAKVAHVPDAAGRNLRDYVRYVIRNDCLGALYNDPWWRLSWTLPGLFARYFRMRRRAGVSDPDGPSWLVRELVASYPRVRAARRPLRAVTFSEWRRLRDLSPPYTPPT